MLFVVVTLTMGLIVVCFLLVWLALQLGIFGTLALYDTTYAIRGGHSTIGASCGALSTNLNNDAYGVLWNRGAALFNYICYTWWSL